MWGGVVGAIVMTWVINGFPSMQQYSGVVYSVIMILLLIFLPGRHPCGLDAAQRARITALLRATDASPTLWSAPCVREWAPPRPCETEMPLPVAPSFRGRRRPRPSAASCSTNLGPREHVPAGETALRVEGVSVHFGGLKAVNEVSLTVQEGRDHRAHRPERGRQDDALQRDQPAAEADRRARVRFAGTDVTKLGPATRPAWAWPAPSRTCASSPT